MEQTQTQEMRQVLRMEQASLLEMPEDEFHKLIGQVEHTPIFHRLFESDKLIRYQRFPGTDVSVGFYQLKEQAIADTGSGEVESLLLNKQYVVGLIQRLGLEKFKRYFLFPESGMTGEEIARGCGLEADDVEKINSLIDELSVVSEFHRPVDAPSGGIHYVKVASIEKEAAGLMIGYLSAHLARGRYAVDYQGFERLRAAGALTETEAREARQLFKKLELINSRKDTMTRILRGIVDRQALYLESGDVKSLLPYTQKELAAKIDVAASSVSRAIRGRSVIAPWGAEVPLEDFFPRPKRFKQELLRQVLEAGGHSSDEAVRTELRERFGVAISRRSVADLRKGLKFPAGGGRRAARLKEVL